MIDLEEIRTFCLSKNGTAEGFPFDEKTLVFKVGGKIYALIDVYELGGINLKCDPEKAIELREAYNGIQPGYHMNKKHWNTVSLNSGVSINLLFELIDHSYELVVASLPKKVRYELSH